MGWPEGLMGSLYKHPAHVCLLEGATYSRKRSKIADPGTREPAVGQPEGQALRWPEPFVLYT